MQIFRNTVVFVVLSIACQLVIGFALALFFQLDFPGAGYLRGLFLAGWIMPALVVGAVWSWILAGDFGVLNYLLMQPRDHRRARSSGSPTRRCRSTR